jgi:hypothetical protein
MNLFPTRKFKFSLHFSKDCQHRFCGESFSHLVLNKDTRIKLTSTNDFYSLSEITFKSLIALLINALQLFVFSIIIFHHVHDRLQHDLTIALAPVNFAIYLLISIELGCIIYTDMSDPLKIFLGIDKNQTLFKRLDWIDMLGIFIEIGIIGLMGLTTVLVTNHEQTVLGMLFNFAGLLVVLNFDNYIVDGDYQEFYPYIDENTEVELIDEENQVTTTHERTIDKQNMKAFSVFCISSVLFVLLVYTSTADPITLL